MLTYKVWVKTFFIISVISYLKIEGTATYVIQEASQTSTNGSYIASLGCDGDMDTFSLTNSGGYQSWNMTLKTKIRIIWIFISIGAGTYIIDISQNGAVPTKCATISQSVERRINTIITCPYFANKLDDEISISNAENKPLKIYEVDIIGISKLNPKLILNFSDFPDTSSKVLDNNFETYFASQENNVATWFLKLDAVYLMKWFLISIRGGTFELHVTGGSTLRKSSTLCRTFRFSGIKQYQAAIECENAISGDTIAVNKMDEGALRLFELFPIICPPNYFGPNCARCRQMCQSCDPITGKCTQCHGSYYGEYCQHSCPRNCLNSTCDRRAGSCISCVDGYKGKTCEQYIVPDTNRKQLFCNHSCVTCEQNIKVCMLCTSSLMLEACQYRCNEICSGSSCLKIQERGKIQKCGIYLINVIQHRNCTISVYHNTTTY